MDCIVHGVTKSQAGLSDFYFYFHFAISKKNQFLNWFIYIIYLFIIKNIYLFIVNSLLMSFAHFSDMFLSLVLDFEEFFRCELYQLSSITYFADIFSQFDFCSLIILMLFYFHVEDEF